MVMGWIWTGIAAVSIFCSFLNGSGAALAAAVADGAQSGFTLAIAMAGSLCLWSGVGTLMDQSLIEANCQKIIEVRQWTAAQLQKLGFTQTDSRANFLFAMHPAADGKDIYLRLKKKGVLIRHFDTPRLSPYNRITVGSRAQMEIFLEKLKEVLEELK